MELVNASAKVRFYKSKLFWSLCALSYFIIDYVMSKSSGSHSYWYWLQSYNRDGEVIGEVIVRLVENAPLILILAYVLYKLTGLILALRRKGESS
jgi:hypothetical protein